jgi:hypothetical protein
MPSFEDFKKALQRRPIPSAWSGELPSLEEMVPWADPVKRGVASPEMMAEQGQRDELMQNAEFRPANKREQGLIELLKELRPYEKNPSLEKKIRSEYPNAQDWTPQVVSESPDINVLTRVFKGKKGTQYQEALDNIIRKDADDLGYGGVDLVRKLNAEDWRKMNRAELREKPPHMYHMTDAENLEGIAKAGITSAKSRGKETNIPGFTDQADRVFLSNKKSVGETFYDPNDYALLNRKIKNQEFEEIFGEIPQKGNVYTSDGIDYKIKSIDADGVILANKDIKTLRTKTPKGIRADIYQDFNDKIDSSESWYQQKKPIPPKALEIETAPDVWEPLIEYMKKRGGK